jgi:hypothetical protein
MMEPTFMRETWLRPNRRALWFGTIPPAIIIALGLWAAFGVDGEWGGWLRWTGLTAMVVGTLMTAAVVNQLRRPRVGYSEGHVQFYLRSGPPLSVPVAIVEAFFLGQGPANLPITNSQESESVNLIARLSEREAEWAHREVKPALGHWCNSYVTIRGTWCEPLSHEVVRFLNRRLHEITRGQDREPVSTP